MFQRVESRDSNSFQFWSLNISISLTPFWNLKLSKIKSHCKNRNLGMKTSFPSSRHFRIIPSVMISPEVETKTETRLLLLNQSEAKISCSTAAVCLLISASETDFNRSAILIRRSFFAILISAIRLKVFLLIWS